MLESATRAVSNGALMEDRSSSHMGRGQLAETAGLVISSAKTTLLALPVALTSTVLAPRSGRARVSIVHGSIELPRFLRSMSATVGDASTVAPGEKPAVV